MADEKKTKHPSISDEAPYEQEWKAAVAAGKFKRTPKPAPKAPAPKP